MEIRFASHKSPDAASNEDFVIATPTFIAVLDGVTVPAGLETGCIHGTIWYVRRLGAHLSQAHEADPTAQLPEVLATAIRGVRTEHEETCNLDHAGTPQSTVCLLRAEENQIEYLILADSPLVVDRGEKVEVITDLRFQTTSQRLRKLAFATASAESSNLSEQVKNLAASQRQHVNRPKGYWISAANPEAAHNAVTGFLPLHGPDRIRRAALLTDGASRAVDTFDLLDWNELLDVLETSGPEHLIAMVRSAEADDAVKACRPRFKRHDDATATYCRFS